MDLENFINTVDVSTSTETTETRRSQALDVDSPSRSPSNALLRVLVFLATPLENVVRRYRMCTRLMHGLLITQSRKSFVI